MSQRHNETTRGKRLFPFSVIVFISIFIVNTLGFTDTATGSALGCGKNWPLCNGQIMPSVWNTAVTIEYTHRISVLVGGLLYLVFAILAWRSYRQAYAVRLLVVFSALGVLLEAALGAIAVLYVNPPAVMATHMGFALWTFVGVGLLMLTIRREELGKSAGLTHSKRTGYQVFDRCTRREFYSGLRSFQHLALWSVPYGYAAIYVGAYVASTGYGGAFQGWPIPTERLGQVGIAFWIDILHRSVALGYLVFMTLLAIRSHRFSARYPQLFHASLTAVTLVCLQALSGWLLIATHLSTVAFLIHVSIVSFLFMTQCHIALEVGRVRQLHNVKGTNTEQVNHKAGCTA